MRFRHIHINARPDWFPAFRLRYLADRDRRGRRAWYWRIQVSSLAEVGFDRTFDAVLCLDVLFHVVDDAQWQASVTGLYHATRPGGYFFVVEHFPKPGSKQATHCRWRSLDDYEGALKGANWIEVLGYQYPQQRVPKTLMIVQRPEGA